ncbi:MAG TPA: hypothetical protein VK737_06750, partial [Opitutales bacterium]|nr:hypothetical protein [Opitutales bacterium]
SAHTSPPTPKKAITNNLRLIASAAQTYMMDKGLTQASYNDVVGTTTDDYIRSLTPVVGEDYTGINIHIDTTEVAIVAPDGTMATYDL